MTDLKENTTEFLISLRRDLVADNERLAEYQELEKAGLDMSSELASFDIEYEFTLKEVNQELQRRGL